MTKNVFMKVKNYHIIFLTVEKPVKTTRVINSF